MRNRQDDVVLGRIDEAIRQLSTSHSPVTIIDDVAKKLNSWQSNTGVLDQLFERFSKSRSRSEKSNQSLALSLRVRCLQVAGNTSFSSKKIAIRSLEYENSELMLFTKRNILIALWRKGDFDYCCWLFENIISRCDQLNEITINTLWHLNGVVSSSLIESGLYQNAYKSARRGLYVADYLSSKNKVEYSLLQCSNVREHVASNSFENSYPEPVLKRISGGSTTLDAINSCFFLISMMRNSTFDINTVASRSYLDIVRERTENLPPSVISTIYIEQARLEIVSGFPKHAIGRMEDAAWILSWYPDTLAQSNYNDVLSTMGQSNLLPPSLIFQCEHSIHSKLQSANRLESVFTKAWIELGLGRLNCRSLDLI